MRSQLRAFTNQLLAERIDLSTLPPPVESREEWRHHQERLTTLQAVTISKRQEVATSEQLVEACREDLQEALVEGALRKDADGARVALARAATQDAENQLAQRREDLAAHEEAVKRLITAGHTLRDSLAAEVRGDVEMAYRAMVADLAARLPEVVAVVDRMMTLADLHPQTLRHLGFVPLADFGSIPKLSNGRLAAFIRHAKTLGVNVPLNGSNK